MNYKLLLWKYIKYVADCEGVSYLEKRYINPEFVKDDRFTKEEVVELQRLDQEEVYESL